MKTAIITTVLAGMLLLGACREEESTISRIKGTVTIDNIDVWESWQDSGEVQLTLFPAFSLDPLAGWGAVPDNFFGPGVPGGTFAVGAPYNSQNPLILTLVPGQTAYDFELEVEPGTYSALALGFRHTFVSDPSLKTATLGVHWDNPDELSHGVVIKVNAGGMLVPIFNYPAPVTFDIAEGETKQIDFKADFGFVKIWYQ